MKIFTMDVQGSLIQLLTLEFIGHVRLITIIVEADGSKGNRAMKEWITLGLGC